MTSKYTLEEVAEHNKPDDCWVIINDRVLDVTKFLEDHPGGDEKILEHAGGDATEDFEYTGHTDEAKDKFDGFQVGVVKKESSERSISTKKEYTWDEVKEHTSKESCWFVMNGKVYDCTKFLDEHPGGDSYLIEVAGTEATDEFDDIGHSDEAQGMLSAYEIGTIQGGASPKRQSKKSDSLLPVVVLIVLAAILYALLWN
eukprot:CAMPEP_0201487296 /NCGR_PEP_ID=MMETSP0151_2-20130828/12194_1 /ASSEMBLY_ACC=CAM_ASM_000257 /TAXON_ID=200890 /ORGANISM="Paramoeba atlantica, Strain 621/1 / CCAP 1560/9" /LENGTH=199 /DNA_ID=CAMNT_0047872295 /DNA_START=130 /DNA_END=729 /DNA_ORIENTATION=-